MSDTLTDFEKADWKSLVPLLTKYALRCIRQYQWTTAGDSLPEGLTPGDVVLAAIEKTYQHLKTGHTGKGFRVWNPANVDLAGFLKGVVKSDINTLVNLSEHELREYFSGKVLNGEKADSIDVVSDAHTSKEVPTLGDEALAERYEKLFAELKKIFAKDAIVLKYLAAVDGIIKDGDDEPGYEMIMKESGLKYNDVKNAKRKIERAVVKLTENMKNRGGEK